MAIKYKIREVRIQMNESETAFTYAYIVDQGDPVADTRAYYEDTVSVAAAPTYVLTDFLDTATGGTEDPLP